MLGLSWRSETSDPLELEVPWAWWLGGQSHKKDGTRIGKGWCDGSVSQVFASKPDHPRSIPWTHAVKGEATPVSRALAFTQAHTNATITKSLQRGGRLDKRHVDQGIPGRENRLLCSSPGEKSSSLFSVKSPS